LRIRISFVTVAFNLDPEKSFFDQTVFSKFP
jgi:hypothetical protein